MAKEGIYIPVTVGLTEGIRSALSIMKPEIKSVQDALNKQPLTMTVKYDRNFRSVENILKATDIDAEKLKKTMASVNKELERYKKAPITPANTAQINKLEAALGALQVKLNSITGKNLGTVAREVERLAVNEDKAAAKADRMSASMRNAAASGRQLGASMRTATDYAALLAHSTTVTANGMRTQSNLLGRTVAHMAVYAGIYRSISMLKSIRDTTAEFELQKVALGGIIQDADKASELFGRIKAAAIKSPFEIKDLVSYTKQLSAYRIETDKLFDTTMMLADVSAGLGVDMSRLILAFGQVRAASVLRGQELRQFTEAGVPLVELLAKKFEQLNGKATSTAEVFELISKRAVPFKMVEEIFQDMTNAGGIFYEMQAKQADTLKGKFMNLKDAVSIAYDEMGRSRTVSNALNGYINLMQDLVKNWRTALSVIKSVSTGLLGYAAVTKILIPLYNLNSKGIWNIIKANKAKAIVDQKLIGLTDLSTKSSKRQIETLKKKTAQDYAAYIQAKKMTDAELILYASRHRGNKAVQEGILLTKRMSKAQLAQLMSVKKSTVAWTYYTAQLGLFAKNVGRALLTMLGNIAKMAATAIPIAAISSLVSIIQDQKQAIEDTDAALAETGKRYKEREMNIRSLIAAYEQLKATVEEVAETEREEAEKAARSEQIRIIQQIQKEMEKFGLRDIFNINFEQYSFSELNGIIEGWTTRLLEANESAKSFAEELDRAANRAEGRILGIRTKGTNLTTDIAQVKKQYAELFGGKDFRRYTDNMRLFVDTMRTENQELYGELSEILGQDAAKAMERKRRNESEYETNIRLLESYKKLWDFMANRDMLFSTKWDALNLFDQPFKDQMQDVYDELKDAYSQIAENDPLQIRIAIDRAFADREWDDWLKEAYIKHLNEEREANQQALIPFYENLGKGAQTVMGFKAILAKEFPTFMSNEELEKISTVDEIIGVIDKKLKEAKTKVQETARLVNNIGVEDIDKSMEEIDKLQTKIREEQEKGEDADQNVLDAYKQQVVLLEKKNEAVSESIAKAKAEAQAQYELADAVRDRLASEGLSTVAKQVRESYTDILADEFKALSDADYSVKFLFSDKELAEIKDVGDLYDKWKSKLTAVNTEMKKLASAGLSEEAVARRSVEIEKKRAELMPQIAELERQIAASGVEEETKTLNQLYLRRAQATTAKELAATEKQISDLLKDGKYIEASKLAIKKQGLQAEANSINYAEEAAKKSKEYIGNLSAIRDQLKGIGVDWGFVASVTDDALAPLYSYFAQDLQTNFKDLIVDPLRKLQDANYSTEFLLSDDDLQKMKGIGGLYDWWEKTTKKITERQLEIDAALVSNQTVSAEIAKSAAEREQIEARLAEIGEQITEQDEAQVQDFKEQEKIVDSTTKRTKERKRAEKKILEYTSQENWNSTYALVNEKKELELQKDRKATIEGVRDSLAEEKSFISDVLIPLLDELAKRYNLELIKKTKATGGRGEDPWILLYKNRMNFMQDFRKDVEKLDKFMLDSEALAMERANMKGRGLAVNIDTAEMTGTRQELIAWYEKTIEEVVAKIKELGGKGKLEGMGVQEILAKDFTGRKLQKYQELLQELWKGLTDFRVEQLQDDMEKKLKSLADKVAQSETAKNFFNDMLSKTGDRQLAADLTLSVYGDIGDGLKQDMIDQVSEAFKGVDISSAIDTKTLSINYRKLSEIYNEHEEEIIEKNRNTAREIVQNGLKTSAEQIKNWYKELEAAETFAKKRVDLARTTAERIREIENSDIPQTEKDALIKQYRAKEAKEAAKLEYEAFKDSPLYIQMFEELDNASYSALTNMRDRIVALKSEWKNLDPVQLKELNRRLNEINAQIGKKNPFDVLAKAIKRYRELSEGGTKQDAETKALSAEVERENRVRRLNEALIAETAAEEHYNDVIKESGISSKEASAAQEELNKKRQDTADARQAADAAKDSADTAQRLVGFWKEVFDLITDAVEGIQEYIKHFEEISNSTIGLLDSLGVESDVIGLLKAETESVSKMLSGGVKAGSGVAQILSGDMVNGIKNVVSGTMDVIAAAADMISGAKIFKANREIERQQKLLNDLERSYERLEVAQAKAFGTDYIDNYSARLAALVAEQEAYEKQAAAERSKGKKADEEKIHEYEDAAEDAANKIKDMSSELSEFFTDMDVTSAAREFAQAWLDAYMEFGNTADAIKEKFGDMIQNMVVNSLMAKVVQTVLQPIFDSIDEMASDGELSSEEIASIADRIPKAISDIDNGLSNVVKDLQASGVNLRQTGGNLTGISRDIATASEESILGLAAGINTQNFYISQIHANVAQILLLMQGNGAQIAQTAVAGTSLMVENPFVTQYLPSIDQHTANIEAYCAETLATLNKVIKPRGTQGAFVVNSSIS